MLQRLQRTRLGPRLCERDVQRPLLPANILVCLAEEVRLSPLLLEKLHGYLAPPARLMGAVYGADQGERLLLNERLEVDVVDGRQGEVEQVAGQRRDGGEVAVEEDGVQDRCAGSVGSGGARWGGSGWAGRTFDDILDAGRVGEDVEIVLWPPSGFHAGICSLGSATVSRRPRGAPRGVFGRPDRSKARRAGGAGERSRGQSRAAAGGLRGRRAGGCGRRIFGIAGAEVWSCGCGAVADEGPTQAEKLTRNGRHAGEIIKEQSALGCSRRRLSVPPPSSFHGALQLSLQCLSSCLT